MSGRSRVHSPVQAMIRVGTLKNVPKMLQSFNLDPFTALTGAGFDPDILDDPDNLIAFAARSQLFEYCATKTNCNHWGLLLGQQASLFDLGLIGLLAKYSPDVGTALNNLVRYFYLHSTCSSISLEVQGRTGVMAYHVHEIGGEESIQLSDGAVAMMFNVMLELCGADWKPTEVWFKHSEPDDVKPFREFFGMRPIFNAEQNALVFNASCLSIRLSQVHPDPYRLVQKQIDALAAQHRDTLSDQVRAILRSSILRGHSSAAQVAQILAMHPRTLARHLNQIGVNFHELLDEICFDLARQMLGKSTLSVKDIALRLDYADSRSFARAFKRWSGESPLRWREHDHHQVEASLTSARSPRSSGR